MPNKNMREMFDKEFNIERTREKILSKEREKEMSSKKIIKWLLVPLCLILILSISLFTSKKDNKDLSTNENSQENNIDSIYINELYEVSSGDADIKIVDNVEIKGYDELADLNVPSELSKRSSYAIYVNEANNKENEYSVLNNYVISYSNSSSDKSITIAFSKDNKPFRDYDFISDDGKTSIINNLELKIYKCSALYFTEFSYKNINFEIESEGITETEFVNLLKSIIK